MLTPDKHLHGGREGRGVPKPSGARACVDERIKCHNVGNHVALPHAIKHRDGALQTPAPSTGASVDESIVCDNVGVHPGCKTMSDPLVRERVLVAMAVSTACPENKQRVQDGAAGTPEIFHGLH
jgi:hypothetical protein